MEKRVQPLTTNTNIFTLLHKQLKKDDKSFIFARHLQFAFKRHA